MATHQLVLKEGLGENQGVADDAQRRSTETTTLAHGKGPRPPTAACLWPNREPTSRDRCWFCRSSLAFTSQAGRTQLPEWWAQAPHGFLRVPSVAP